MAGASGEYHHGEMPVEEQKATWRSFTRVTLWASVMICMLLLQITLHFAAGVSWWPALGAAVVFGLVAGALTNMGAAWTATVIGLAVLGGIVGGLMALTGAAT